MSEVSHCNGCGYTPCQCARRGWARELSPETHARGEMVRRTLPWGAFLALDGAVRRLLERDEEINRLESVAPKHLAPDELLELYCLELIEALKSERARRARQGN